MLKPLRVISKVLNRLNAQFLVCSDFPFLTLFNIATALFMFALKVHVQLILSFKAFLNVAFTGCNRAVHFLRGSKHAVDFFFVSMEIGTGWKTLDCSATFCNALMPYSGN